MRRGVGCVVAIFVVCLFGASSTQAYVVDYKEGQTNVGFPSTVRWSVKPNGGVNEWYWFHNNNLGVPTAVCYRYQKNGGPILAPGGGAYATPVVNSTAAKPSTGTANPASCEGPYNTYNSYLPDDKQLSGLVNGDLVTYCAKEWYKSDNTWDQTADPERCEAIVVDTTSPNVSVDLRQGGNSVSTTNSPGSVQTRINYSDSLTPPWRVGSIFGDNRLCVQTGAPCNSGNTHNYSSACSNGTESLVQSFDCPLGTTPSSEGNFYQCFASYDGAVLDVPPSLLTDSNPSNNDPAFTSTNIQTFNAGTGNVALACDSVLVDTTAPNTNITGGPADGSSSSDTTPTFSFTSTEGGSTFQCKLSVAGTYQSCSSGYTPTLSPGTYTFHVRATDAAGNTDGTAATRTFTITGPPDTTPPDTSITDGPPGGSTTSDDTPTFSFTSTEGGTFQCAVDLNSFVACSSPFTTVPLTDGPHTFNVYAVDTAGNPDMSPATRSFTVDTSGPPDTSPPDTSITGGPAEGSTISDTTPEFSFSSNEAGTFECKVDSGAFIACASPFTAPVLVAGAHSFSVRATDGAGNTDASPATRSFTVKTGGSPPPPKDTTAPQTTIRTKPKKSTTSRKSKFTFGSNEAGSTFTCRLDKAPYRTCRSPFSKKVKPGKHKFSVKATDGAGNMDASAATFSWKVKKKR